MSNARFLRIDGRASVKCADCGCRDGVIYTGFTTVEGGRNLFNGFRHLRKTTHVVRRGRGDVPIFLGQCDNDHGPALIIWTGVMQAGETFYFVSDETLYRRFLRHRDGRAFQTILRRRREMVVSEALKIVRDEAEAERIMWRVFGELRRAGDYGEDIRGRLALCVGARMSFAEMLRLTIGSMSVEAGVDEPIDSA